MKIISKFPFHLFAFSSFPVLSLYVTNIDKLRFTNILGMLFINVVLAFLAWRILCIRKNRCEIRASIISISFVLFYSYGVYPTLFSSVASFGDLQKKEYLQALFETRWVNAILMICLCVFGYLLIKFLYHIRKKVNITFGLNIIGYALLLSVVTSIPSPRSIKEDILLSQNNYGFTWLDKLSKDSQDLHVTNNYMPDIYIIILDGYARHDILQEMYDYDNSTFISYLREKGFYIADKSHSNYGLTHFSIASMLNYSYLDTLADQLPDGFSNLKPIGEIIAFNRTFSQLRKVGYKVVAYSSGWTLTNLYNADQFHQMPLTINDFSTTLLNNTPLQNFSNQQNKIHRQQILFGFENLPKLADDPDPTIAFLHVIAPHPPFVFDENGKPVNSNRKYSMLDASDFLVIGSEQEYIKGYHGQVIYITKLVQNTINEILTKSSHEPIIILQGDHGSRLLFDFEDLENTDPKESYSILNAYLLPQVDNKLLYSTISPVNSMRIIFNTYFGTQYTILDDQSYYLSQDSIYKHINITDLLE